MPSAGGEHAKLKMLSLYNALLYSLSKLVVSHLVELMKVVCVWVYVVMPADQLRLP